MQTEDERWAAVVARDATRDGDFYYSVKTTGVFCKPSCASRQARRENVYFFDSLESARAAGFRPCKRCRPGEAALQEQRVDLVAQACRLLRADSTYSLDELAAKAFLSPFHFHRIFKEVTGMTPKQYAIAQRPNQQIRYEVSASSLGPILIAATRKGVCSVFFDEDPEAMVLELKRRFPRAELTAANGDQQFEAWRNGVLALVEGPGDSDAPPLDVHGTDFQKKVWQALREIPFGETANYGEIARKIGAVDGARAVAGACGANHISVLIPCHRVVKSNGDISGYRWGVERKRILLEKEARARR